MPSSPRPILKRTSTTSTRAVHFPPSPTLTRTFSAHSSTFYNRSPIVVAPNSCALPERGCPGRTYTIDDAPPPSSCRTSNHRHPRALFPPSSPPQPHPDDLLPPLVPDLSSSESDESDAMPPRSLLNFAPPPPALDPPISHPISYASAPAPPHTFLLLSDPVPDPARARAPSPSFSLSLKPPKPRKRPDRRRGVPAPLPTLHPAEGDDEPGYKSLAMCRAFSGFSIADTTSVQSDPYGCLGGF